MSKKVIVTKHAPGAIGPYSQAIETESGIYISGQLPVDPTTGGFAGMDIQSQSRQSLENIKAILKEAGLTMANVVKTTVYLKDISEFGAMNEIYAQYFEEAFPVRAAFQVAALPKDARVEIEAVAVR